MIDDISQFIYCSYMFHDFSIDDILQFIYCSYMINVSIFTSSWLIVCVAVERLLIVIFPLKVQLLIHSLFTKFRNSKKS